MIGLICLPAMYFLVIWLNLGKGGILAEELPCPALRTSWDIQFREA